MKLGVSSKGSARSTSDGRKTAAAPDADLASRNAELAAALEQARDELDAMTHSISHDLRAPLRHLSGFVDLLRTQLATPDVESRRYLDAVSTAAVRMNEMIDRLLALSRAGREALNPGPVELRPLVDEVCSELRPNCAGRTIEWRIGALPTVRADRPLLRSALVELLGNAVKFTSGRIPAILELESRSAEDEHEIVVRDNGAGFDMKYSEKLFGVFQRLHGQAEFAGTGVGLAIVRKIILRHGGRTWIEGVVGGGTTFHFTLPAREEPQGEEAAS